MIARTLIFILARVYAVQSPSKWAHLPLVPFLELTRRSPKGSLRRILSGSERERFASPKVLVKVTATSYIFFF
jgi:hypothetical protein